MDQKLTSQSDERPKCQTDVCPTYGTSIHRRGQGRRGGHGRLGGAGIWREEPRVVSSHFNQSRPSTIASSGDSILISRPTQSTRNRRLPHRQTLEDIPFVRFISPHNIQQGRNSRHDPFTLFTYSRHTRNRLSFKLTGCSSAGFPSFHTIQPVRGSW